MKKVWRFIWWLGKLQNLPNLMLPIVNKAIVPESEIAVSHQPFSDQFQDLTEQK